MSRATKSHGAHKANPLSSALRYPGCALGGRPLRFVTVPPAALAIARRLRKSTAVVAARSPTVDATPEDRRHATVAVASTEPAADAADRHGSRGAIASSLVREALPNPSVDIEDDHPHITDVHTVVADSAASSKKKGATCRGARKVRSGEAVQFGRAIGVTVGPKQKRNPTKPPHKKTLRWRSRKTDQAPPKAGPR